jgi:hypothetical protein
MVEVLEIGIQEKEVEGKKFYHFDVSGSRGSFRVWINPRYYQENLDGKKYILGIFKNARVEKTQKGTLVIKKGQHNLFLVRVKCGFRGDSEFEALNSLNVFKFYYKHSPNGALGVSECGLVETVDDFVKIQWKRSGRLYGNPSRGISIVKIDGTVQELNGVELEELNEIIAD